MKNCEEWELAFDQYFNNITSNKAPGLEPCEKSRFLTDAEYAIVIGLYNGTIGGPFESNEQVTEYLASLVKQMTVTEPIEATESIVSSAKVYSVGGNVLFRTLEKCSLTGTPCGAVSDVEVIPVTQDEIFRTIRNPFKGPNHRRVLRVVRAENSLQEGKLVESSFSELISKYPISSYTVRYVERPKPIILQDLPEGMTLDGENEAMPCMLPESLHSIILSEAVRMAKAVWQS